MSELTPQEQACAQIKLSGRNTSQILHSNVSCQHIKSRCWNDLKVSALQAVLRLDCVQSNHPQSNYSTCGQTQLPGAGIGGATGM